MRRYYVYILASASGVLYTGVTNAIRRRVIQHRLKLIPGFTKKYNVTKLVYFEVFGQVRMAIAREKQIKAWTRKKRVALIADWFPDPLPR
jgi:putative endonuclease